MKRALKVLRILVIATICLAVGGFVSYVYVLKSMPATQYVFNKVVGGQRLYVEFNFSENYRYEYKLYSETASQIRAISYGEYRIENDVLMVKKDGTSGYVTFGKINKYHIATDTINFDDAGVTFTGDFMFDCKETINANANCLAIFYTGAGISIALLLAILAIRVVQTVRKKPKYNLGEGSQTTTKEN